MIYLCLGAPEAYIPPTFEKKEGDLVIGVDHGTMVWRDHGVKVDVAIGDFDSLSAEEKAFLAQIELVITYPAEKDDTDTEAALKWILSQDYEEDITIYGAFGGRLDHTISLLWLAYHPILEQVARRLTFVGERALMKFYFPGTYQIKDERHWRYLSFILLTPISKLSLKGVKYELEGVDVGRPRAYISNEFEAEQMTLSFQTGRIAMIQTPDDHQSQLKA